MARYLVEIPHAADALACLQAIQIFLKTGSHFLTHCDWGCVDGEHMVWINVEVDSKDEALRDEAIAYYQTASQAFKAHRLQGPGY